jgi:uncharacterized protein (DUF1501 family)
MKSEDAGKMKDDQRKSRRSVIKWAAMAGVASTLPTKGLAASGDRAVVMIMLIGGNDSNNMIVPFDDATYGAYRQARGFLALPQSSLLPVASRQGVNFGFHPAMADVQRLYSTGRLAVLANEGALAAPTTKAALLTRAARLPANLFQHTGGDHLRYVPPAAAFPTWAVEQQRRSDIPEERGTQVFRFGAIAALSLDRPKIQGAIEDNPALTAAMNRVRVTTPFPGTSLGQQLLKIAKLIEASPSVGFTRPVFTAMMSGFDTHSDQLARQNELFSELSQALGAFQEATVELGIGHRVTTFTHTEFNRTLSPNNTGGTEHAWGGHHLILGGTVAGGDIYGTFPSAAPDGAENIGNGGMFVPTVSGEEYVGMFGRWHGVRSTGVSLPATRELGILF